MHNRLLSSVAAWAAPRAPVAALAALSLLLMACDRVFGLDKVPPPVKANYYTCDCNCSTRIVATVRVTVRAGPNQNPTQGMVDAGGLGTLVDGPEEADFGGTPTPWWKVKFDVGIEGWVPQPTFSLDDETKMSKKAQACVPLQYNQNKGGTEPSIDDLQGVCSVDVALEAQEFITQKMAPLGKVLCGCDAKSLQFTDYNSSCDAPCPDGGNVCLLAGSDPPDPTPTLISEALFLPASECRVTTGGAELVVGGHTPKSQPAVQGVVQIYGRPCAQGQGCLASMSYQLTGDDIEFDSGTIFASDPKFVDLSLSGATEPEVINLGPFLGGHIGEIPAGTTLSSVFGRRSGSTDAFSLDGRNTEGIALAMSWSGKTCRLSGQVLGQAEGDEGEGTVDAQVDVVIDGVLENQPPRPDAGADQTVECTSATGADVSLDGSGSTDADGNIALYEWRRGSATGTQVAVPSANPVVQTLQALGQQTYHLMVVDSRFSADTDLVEVSVVDTTGPEIACNAPATITPNDVPEKRTEGISFTASAQDLCGGVSSVAISDYSCTKARSCRVSYQGATLTIYDSGGVGDIIRWTVEAEDAAGNRTQKSCELTVVKK